MPPPLLQEMGSRALGLGEDSYQPFTRAFQELPLFTQRGPNGDLFYAGMIDGSIEISVTPGGPGAWRRRLRRPAAQHHQDFALGAELGVRASPRRGWVLELAGRPCHDS
jgi:hypothetical protein